MSSRDPYKLRCVFGYQTTLDPHRKNRIRFFQVLTSVQYKLLITLLEPWQGQFEKSCTAANVKLFELVLQAIPATALEYRASQMQAGTMVFAFYDRDYDALREAIRKLSLLQEAGYFSPGNKFRATPSVLATAKA